MAFLGFRAYPTPILKPLWPFFASSAIVYYAVAKIQASGVRSPEFAKDPKNPYGTYHIDLGVDSVLTRDFTCYSTVVSQANR